MDEVHPGGVFGEVAGLLTGTVAPSYDRDGLVPDQRRSPVTDGASADTSVPETRILVMEQSNQNLTTSLDIYLGSIIGAVLHTSGYHAIPHRQVAMAMIIWTANHLI